MRIVAKVGRGRTTVEVEERLRETEREARPLDEGAVGIERVRAVAKAYLWS